MRFGSYQLVLEDVAPSKGCWSQRRGCGIEGLGAGCCRNAITTTNAISLLQDTAIGEPLPRGLVNCQAKNKRAPRGITRVKSSQGTGTPGLAPWKGACSELWEVEEVVATAAGDAGAMNSLLNKMLARKEENWHCFFSLHFRK